MAKSEIVATPITFFAAGSQKEMNVMASIEEGVACKNSCVFYGRPFKYKLRVYHIIARLKLRGLTIFTDRGALNFLLYYYL